MKYPAKGKIKKKYVTIEYVKDKETMAHDEEYEEAVEQVKSGSLLLGGETITEERLLVSHMSDKWIPVMILGERIEHRARVSRKGEDGNIGEWSCPDQYFSIVEKETGKPQLLLSTEVKFDIEPLNTGL